jgi:phosphopantothenoylcysteine decarboxylase/phosphopantothenate--cysteine ligase
MVFVVIGVTGGIAAYKTVHLVRLLVKAGHDVHVVPTEDAVRFVGLPTWEAISRNPVTTSVHDDVARVRHVSLGQSADLVIVAPATANSLAKMATGLADDLLGTTLLATTAPVVVAPAMHTEMWRHPATVHNMQTLRDRGVIVVGPDDGALTGGDSGPGRMSEPEAILEAALAAAGGSRSDLGGVRVVVTAGGTREPIDPVRYIGNRSSGRQGVAVALAAAERGADVVLIAAHVDDGVLAEASASARLKIVRTGTAAELGRAAADEASAADVVVMAAAVADYRVADVSESKLSKDAAPGRGLRLDLVENDDILAGLVGVRRDGQTIVGFAAETPGEGETLLDRGRRKAARKGADLLAVNQVGWSLGFEANENEILILTAEGDVVETTRGTKREVADALWDAVLAVRRNPGQNRGKTK